jgi:hypothetical protein
MIEGEGNNSSTRQLSRTAWLFSTLALIGIPPRHSFNMHFLALFSGLTAITSALVAAAPSVEPSLLSSRATTAPCKFNSATAPSCWGNYSLSTNWYNESPTTGVTREYWFDVVNTTLAPDGFSRMVLTVNGTIPGPTIVADWGDTVGKRCFGCLLKTPY